MQKIGNSVLYSASDVVNFLECEHLTSLDIQNLETPLVKSESTDEEMLIQQKGLEHEARYLQHLKTKATSYIDASAAGSDLDQRVAATKDALLAGTDLIFQGTLRNGCLIGHADFLRRTQAALDRGNVAYEVLDTKLARSPKAKFVVQLCFYSHLLSTTTGAEPRDMVIVLGDGREETYRYADYKYYFYALLDRFLEGVASKENSTYPNPCARCELCRWRDICDDRREQDDHLSRVAGITRIQTEKLIGANVDTLTRLASVSPGLTVPRLASETLRKLHSQAALQLRAAVEKKRFYELLSPEKPSAGLARLPPPSAGDIYFDMEGDPLEIGGLEYLFGVMHVEAGEQVFQPFWAHSRADEKLAFEDFVDFVVAHLSKFPDAHIYHYAPYETTAIKRLMQVHGTREAAVDNLLRMGKFVDLYQVVREGIRVSEPSYSIKNIERFYFEERQGSVTNAGASIVYYERWKQTGEQAHLDAIEAYNRDDVLSTLGLHTWLQQIRPHELPWAAKHPAEGSDEIQLGELTDAERRLLPYYNALVANLPTDRSLWSFHEELAELTYQLLDFFRRIAKPVWWSMYARQEMEQADLIADGECLGGLTKDESLGPRPDKRSIRYTYLFPPQETKLRTGATAVVTTTMASVSDLEVDEERLQVRFRYSAKKDPLPDLIALGPGRPFDTKSLQEALFRFADSIIKQDGKYAAIRSYLARDVPRIIGRSVGDPIIDSTADPLAGSIAAVAALDQSYLFVQGPPGAGKTYTGARVIVELLRNGRTVGISSNSHKAIHNLLEEVERVSQSHKFGYSGVKKATPDKDETVFISKNIESVETNDEVVEGNYQLIAGTAWLFADESLDQRLDYLFVDEAGQVALAYLVAMGTSAKNIVLLGDQMQLGQPVQGTHPGRSGESSLEYLLDGAATIPEERGIFLSTTWRMHPDICKFISDAVYDSRLLPEERNFIRQLRLDSAAHPALKTTGLSFVPVIHDGCSQRSEEEAAAVNELVTSLLTQGYTDKSGNENALTLANILVVAPYNMQVNLLKKVLPIGARVGTVDKFQGQEAEVVILSMATSSGEYLPRFIEFLYSKNRLNVAISRARCLAVLVLNPALLSIQCSKVEEMALVNTLCWARQYASIDGRPPEK